MTTKLSLPIKIRRIARIGFTTALFILLTDCASGPPLVIHDAVGPDLALKQKQSGFLSVFSSTAWMRDSDGPSLLGHTDYEIISTDYSFHEIVRNGDTEPARVLLPAGNYIVEAESDIVGLVRVPVVIKAGRTTILYLEREKDSQGAFADRDLTELVRLPSGQPIGVRARPETPAKS